MKIINTTRNQNRNVEHNLTRDISVFYLVLLAILMIVPARMVQADVAHTSVEITGASRFPTLIAVGDGELTWFGLSIYQASLWTATGEYQNIKDSLPIALTITYDKHIASDDLAQRTVEEWEHLDIFDSEWRASWAVRLRHIWPNVKPGDSITTLVTNDRKTQFYYNDKPLTMFDDPMFGVALLSIWLDPNTSKPELRAKLIGQQES